MSTLDSTLHEVSHMILYSVRIDGEELVLVQTRNSRDLGTTMHGFTHPWSGISPEDGVCAAGLGLRLRRISDCFPADSASRASIPT